MIKVYIAGKVTGTPIAECTLKFGTAQGKIEAMGAQAINPLAVVNDWHAPWGLAMKKCLKALLDADVVLFLPDYDQSTGALLEEKVTKAVGINSCYSIQSLSSYIKKHTKTHG